MTVLLSFDFYECFIAAYTDTYHSTIDPYFVIVWLCHKVKQFIAWLSLYIARDFDIIGLKFLIWGLRFQCGAFNHVQRHSIHSSYIKYDFFSKFACCLGQISLIYDFSVSFCWQYSWRQDMLNFSICLIFLGAWKGGNWSFKWIILF